MPQLSTNLSDHSLSLLDEQPGLVDSLEIGLWCPLEELRQVRQKLPTMPFTFHPGNLVTRLGLKRSAVPTARAYQQASGSPWVSFHLTLWFPGVVELMVLHKVRLPQPNTWLAERRLVWQVRRWQKSLPVPLLLENIDPFPSYADSFNCRPEVIRDVLEQTGCGLLLDIGHARVAASALEMDVEDYLSALPLDTVRQIHVSGPRVKDGRLVDAHEPMQEEDYRLLEVALRRTNPTLVTLEYNRSRQELIGQLERLRGIIK